MRSSIHPYLFGAVYFISNLISDYLSISPLNRANLLLAAPKLTQALFAAVGDFYTWKLAGKVYGNYSYEAWGAVSDTAARTYICQISDTDYSLVARIDCPKSLAVVLLDANIIKLPRDKPHNRRIVFVAMGMAIGIILPTKDWYQL